MGLLRGISTWHEAVQVGASEVENERAIAGEKIKASNFTQCPSFLGEGILARRETVACLRSLIVLGPQSLSGEFPIMQHSFFR